MGEEVFCRCAFWVFVTLMSAPATIPDTKNKVLFLYSGSFCLIYSCQKSIEIARITSIIKMILVYFLSLYFLDNRIKRFCANSNLISGF